jgi:hypothetical protein
VFGGSSPEVLKGQGSKVKGSFKTSQHPVRGTKCTEYDIFPGGCVYFSFLGGLYPILYVYSELERHRLTLAQHWPATNAQSRRNVPGHKNEARRQTRVPWNQPREGIGDDVKPALGPSNSGANGQTWETPAAFYL